MNTKHTPTPWKVRETRYFSGKLISRWIGRGQLKIASVTNNDEANARHIVRCVNNFDTLLEACNKAKHFLTELIHKEGFDDDIYCFECGESKGETHHPDCKSGKIIMTLEAAITEAEKE